MNPEFQKSTKQTAKNQVDVASDFTRVVSFAFVGSNVNKIIMSGSLAIRKTGLENRGGKAGMEKCVWM